MKGNEVPIEVSNPSDPETLQRVHEAFLSRSIEGSPGRCAAMCSAVYRLPGLQWMSVSVPRRSERAGLAVDGIGRFDEFAA